MHGMHSLYACIYYAIMNISMLILGIKIKPVNRKDRLIKPLKISRYTVLHSIMPNSVHIALHHHNTHNFSISSVGI